MSASLSLTVPADAGYLKCIRGFVTPVLAMRFPEDEVGPIVLAIDEACSNIIKHGQHWLLPKGRISLEVTDSKKRVVVKINNFCKESDVDKIRPRDLDDVKPGGLGTHFMKAVMDSVEFEPDPDRDGRMSLVMVKSTGRKENNEADN